MITISKNLFITNKKNVPVLSKNHQSIVKKLMNYEVKVVITGNNYLSNSSNAYDENYKCNCHGGEWKVDNYCV